MSSFNKPEGYDSFDTKSLAQGATWQCQEEKCGKTTTKPYRWVVGSKTTFACDSCNGKVKIVGSEEKFLIEELSKKVSLLHQQVMALHQRIDDQLGKP